MLAESSYLPPPPLSPKDLPRWALALFPSLRPSTFLDLFSLFLLSLFLPRASPGPAEEAAWAGRDPESEGPTPSGLATRRQVYGGAAPRRTAPGEWLAEWPGRPGRRR